MKTEKGFSLIASIFIMVIFLMLGVTLVSMLSADVYSASRSLNYVQAFYSADGMAGYIINRILKNDYNWENNNFADPVTTPPLNLPAGSGYPVGSGDYLGDANYNALGQRDLDGSFIGGFITLVSAPPADNTPDPHWPATQYWPWVKCVINVPSHAQGSHAAVDQEVFRYLCPSLNYAVSARGSINIDGQSLELHEKGDISKPLTMISSDNIYYLPSSPPLPPIEYPGKVSYPPETTDMWFPLGVDIDKFMASFPSDFIAATIADNADLPPGEYNGIIYGQGTIWIAGSGPGNTVTINGAIVAKGGIKIRPGTTLTINSRRFMPDIYLPAIVAAGNIQGINGSAASISISGLVYSDGFISMESTGILEINGAIAASSGSPTTNRGIYLKTAGVQELKILYDPVVRLTYGMLDNHPNRGEMLNNTFRFGTWQEVLKFKQKPTPPAP